MGFFAGFKPEYQIKRYPGYIAGSEFTFVDTATFVGATAAGLSVPAKAATARRKNVMTGLEFSFYNGATASSWFMYIIDGPAPTTATNPRWFAQRNAPVNSSENYSIAFPPDDPIIFSVNSDIRVVNNAGGVAGAVCQVVIKGYQIAA